MSNAEHRREMVEKLMRPVTYTQSSGADVWPGFTRLKRLFGLRTAPDVQRAGVPGAGSPGLNDASAAPLRPLRP